jgi:hypothetical protein
LHGYDIHKRLSDKLFFQYITFSLPRQVQNASRNATGAGLPRIEKALRLAEPQRSISFCTP